MMMNPDAAEYLMREYAVSQLLSDVCEILGKAVDIKAFTGDFNEGGLSVEKDLFDNMDMREREREKKRVRRKIWKGVRPVLIVVLSLAIALGGVYVVGKKVYNKFFVPVDINDATPVEITIPQGYGASYRQNALRGGTYKQQGRVQGICRLYGKVLKPAPRYLHTFQNMDISQMVDIICKGNPPRTTLKLTVTEGTSISDIGLKLVSLGVLETPDEFYELCRTAEEFMDYPFIAAIKDDPKEARKFKLEGYLFPDTYEIYADSSPKEIINKMLVRFYDVFDTEYSERAEELGMSIDDVIKLASLIEREAKTADFEKVSAVFHNRLKADMRLDSDAPLRYIFDTNTLQFSEEMINSTSLYNTRCIRAAAWSDNKPGQGGDTRGAVPERGIPERVLLFLPEGQGDG